MPKVEYKDLEKITRFLDIIAKVLVFQKHSNKAKELSKMIKDKYTKIKPDYEQ